MLRVQLSKPIIINNNVLVLPLLMDSVSSISLPKLFFLTHGVFLNHTHGSPASFLLPVLALASWVLLPTHSLGIGIVLAISGLCSDPPRWGAVSIPVQPGWSVFSVSHCLQGHNSSSFWNVCPGRPGQEHPGNCWTYRSPSHLCSLATGSLPGCCTWTFRIIFPN